jgi:excisionase family DNA binding protein
LAEAPLAYRIPDAVKVSGIGRSTLYKLIRDGKIQSASALGRRLIPRASLEAFLASGGVKE